MTLKLRKMTGKQAGEEREARSFWQIKENRMCKGLGAPKGWC
jgi:hypothetical protein